MRLEELRRSQSGVVAGVYGGPNSIPRLEVSDKGVLLSITEVPAPRFAGLQRAEAFDKLITVYFDQQLKLLDSGLERVSVEVNSKSVEVELIELSPVDSKRLLIKLKERVYRNAQIVLTVDGSCLESAETGLRVPRVSKRIVQNQSGPREYSELARVQITGLGSRVIYSDYARSAVATKLDESALVIYAVGGEPGLIQRQQLEVGDCSGSTPLKHSESLAALLIGGFCVLYQWDKSCRQYAELARIESKGAVDIAISRDVLFILYPLRLDAYSVEGGVLTLLGSQIVDQGRAIEAQASGYQICVVENSSAKIYSRRTTESWALSRAIALDSRESQIAFNGETLAVSDPESDAVTIFDRISGVWRQRARLERAGGSSMSLSGDVLAVGNFRLNRVVCYERGAGSWAGARRQEITLDQRADFGETVAVSEVDRLLIVGAPLLNSLIVYGN